MAIVCSISMISNFVLLVVYWKISNILFVVKARGTLTFVEGSVDRMERIDMSP